MKNTKKTDGKTSGESILATEMQDKEAVREFNEKWCKIQNDRLGVTEMQENKFLVGAIVLDLAELDLKNIRKVHNFVSNLVYVEAQN